MNDVLNCIVRAVLISIQTNHLIGFITHVETVVHVLIALATAGEKIAV